jgi:transposase InsO family protein
MSVANPLWGAPRAFIGEILKLGVEVAQSTVAKYMVRGRGPPSQSWKTFLRNHGADIAAMDLMVVSTIGFRLLYVLIILGLHRRRILSFGVTSHPTAEWVARQVTDAFPWTEAPRYLIRDRDAVYGQVVTRRLKSMGIRDRPTAPRSPWQNGHVERLIGSIRRECLDHIVVFGEAHLRRIVGAYVTYYITTKLEHISHCGRMLRSGDRFIGSGGSFQCPSSVACTTNTAGRSFRFSVGTEVIREPVLGGLHHVYHLAT